MISDVGLLTFVVLGVIVLNFATLRFLSKKIYKSDTVRKEQMDLRSSLVDEAIIGIKNVKFNGWEEIINKKMKDIRKKESSMIGWLMAYLGQQMTCNNMVIPLGCFACLSLYIFFTESPSLSSVFSFLLYLSVIYSPIQALGYCLFMFGSIKLSLERVKKVMNLEDAKHYSGGLTDLNEGGKGQLVVKNGTFSWYDPNEKSNKSKKEGQGTIMENGEQNKDKFLVKSIELKLSNKETCYLVGRVGSGKSSLIYALIDNLYKLEGEVNLSGSVALIPQEPFLLNDTLRNNILFGKEFDEEKYHHVLRICELENDLKILSAGDKTEIGERGEGDQPLRRPEAESLDCQSCLF